MDDGVVTKRIRRSFSVRVWAMFDKKAKGIDEATYQKFQGKVEALCAEFEEATKGKKVDKRKYKALKKFTKEEIREYLKNLE